MNAEFDAQSLITEWLNGSRLSVVRIFKGLKDSEKLWLIVAFSENAQMKGDLKTFYNLVLGLED